jgi:hypothetical protein
LERSDSLEVEELHAKCSKIDVCRQNDQVTNVWLPLAKHLFPTLINSVIGDLPIIIGYLPRSCEIKRGRPEEINKWERISTVDALTHDGRGDSNVLLLILGDMSKAMQHGSAYVAFDRIPPKVHSA